MREILRNVVGKKHVLDSVRDLEDALHVEITVYKKDGPTQRRDNIKNPISNAFNNQIALLCDGASIGVLYTKKQVKILGKFSA